MILSKKSRYGLRALVDLSVSSKTEHMALNVIAERNGISPQYLEQVFAALRRAGIVRSIKGPQGGYLLNKPADEITVAEIVLALDGSYHVEDETATRNCELHGITGTLQRLVVDRINEQLDAALTSITLADLENDYVKTTKKEKDRHGYGQIVIRSVIQKYGAIAKVVCRDGEFNIRIAFPEAA